MALINFRFTANFTVELSAGVRVSQITKGLSELDISCGSECTCTPKDQPTIVTFDLRSTELVALYDALSVVNANLEIVGGCLIDVTL